MLSIWLTRAIVFVLAAPAPPAQAAGPPADYADVGPREVASVRVEWLDAARKRPVPAKIYYPADDEGPFAVVIFSHGLGGSREGYAYLGRHWASHGFVSVHLEHEGSDAEVWRGQAKAAEEMQRAAKDPLNSINRPKDVSFAIDQLARMQEEDGGPLVDLLALEKVAVAGHSFGAFTALAVAGEAGTHVSDARSLADKRVKAAIPMSAPVPVRKDRYDQVYGQISIPCLHMTGTLDETPVAFTKADDRRIPYDHITRADQYLVTFAGGDHAIFSGRVRRGRYAEKDALFQELIRLSTTAFLDAHLNGNPEAKAWLQTGGLKAALAANARLEFKQPTTQPAEPEAASGRTAPRSRSRAPVGARDSLGGFQEPMLQDCGSLLPRWRGRDICGSKLPQSSDKRPAGSGTGPSRAAGAMNTLDPIRPRDLHLMHDPIQTATRRSTCSHGHAQARMSAGLSCWIIYAIL